MVQTQDACSQRLPSRRHVANIISRCDFVVCRSLHSVTCSGLPTALQTNFKRSPYSLPVTRSLCRRRRRRSAAVQRSTHCSYMSSGHPTAYGKSFVAQPVQSGLPTAHDSIIPQRGLNRPGPATRITRYAPKCDGSAFGFCSLAAVRRGTGGRQRLGEMVLTLFRRNVHHGSPYMR